VRKTGFRRTKALISLKRGKIGHKLLLRTNRKSHKRFRLVPKSTTLDDPEGHYAPRFKTRASFGAHNENLSENRHTLKRRRCSPVTRCCLYKVYADGVPRRRGVKRQWGNRKHGFSKVCVFCTLVNEVNVIYYIVFFNPFRLSTDSEMTSSGSEWLARPLHFKFSLFWPAFE